MLRILHSIAWYVLAIVRPFIISATTTLATAHRSIFNLIRICIFNFERKLLTSTLNNRNGIKQTFILIRIIVRPFSTTHSAYSTHIITTYILYLQFHYSTYSLLLLLLLLLRYAADMRNSLQETYLHMFDKPFLPNAYALRQSFSVGRVCGCKNAAVAMNNSSDGKMLLFVRAYEQWATTVRAIFGRKSKGNSQTIWYIN